MRLPEKLIPIFQGEARYRGAYGGRGSGKTRTFALMTAVKGYEFGMAGVSGQILCGREFMVSLKDSSFQEVKSAIQSVDWLNAYYEIGENYIRSKDRRITYTFSGLRHSLNSIKSQARILLCWIDEAEPVMEIAWGKLTPTVREEGSEIWVTWNPEVEGSATDIRFKKNPPSKSKIVEMNHADNQWFPEVLELERLDDQRKRPDTYDHVWEGGYKTISEALIFNGRFSVEEFVTPEIFNPYFGLDWGFANDPTATLRCFVEDNNLYIDYEAGGTRIEIDETYRLINVLPESKRYIIRADSARPESISFVHRQGYRIESVYKWPGSVEDGIEFIKSFDHIYIHPRCKEVANEFRVYSFKTDRTTGDILPVPLDTDNHYIDALRYALQPMIKRKGKPKLARVIGT